MNINFKNLLIKSSVLAITLAAIISCDDDDSTTVVVPTREATVETKYFALIEAAESASADVLASAESLESGVVTPVNNGIEQLGWSTAVQGENQIFSIINNTITNYTLVEGELTQGVTLTAGDLGILAIDVVDESNAVIMTAPWYAIGGKTLRHINLDEMIFTNNVDTNLDDDPVITPDGDTSIDAKGLTLPSDMEVVGDRLFVSYYPYDQFNSTEDNDGDGFPDSVTTTLDWGARIAVYSYPDFEYQETISDDRISSIGRYLSQNGLASDENGDLYAISTSSLASGYFPTPEANSGILRINNGESEFDSDFYIDFETLSGGYKLNDFYYLGEGKAVVRMLQEDETNLLFFWGSYAPTSEFPLLEFAIIDLYEETFIPISGDIPNSGGGWPSAVLVEDDKVFVGVSNSTYSGVYVIDVDTATVTEGADIEGNYAKGLFSIETTEE